MLEKFTYSRFSLLASLLVIAFFTFSLLALSQIFDSTASAHQSNYELSKRYINLESERNNYSALLDSLTSQNLDSLIIDSLFFYRNLAHELSDSSDSYLKNLDKLKESQLTQKADMKELEQMLNAHADELYDVEVRFSDSLFALRQIRRQQDFFRKLSETLSNQNDSLFDVNKQLMRENKVLRDSL